MRNLYKTNKLKLKGATTRLFLLFAFLSFSLTLTHAQIAGETCDNPIVVTSLPFNDSGNTGTYGNNYGIADVPPLAPGAVTTGTGSEYYLSGAEVVYSITPTSDGTISINTTNDDDWVGLWAFTGCPFTSAVGYHTATSGATRSITDLPVVTGETYYIVLSTWTPPEVTDFTIEITGDVSLGGGGGEPADWTDCEQDYYSPTMNPVDYPTGVGFSGGNIVANDVVVAPFSSFRPQTLTFDVILLSGTPTDFDIQLYDDNGTGGVGAANGPTYTLTPADYVATNVGLWDGAYPLYEIEVDLSIANIQLDNNTANDAYWWVGISSDLSSTGDFTYWNSYPYAGGPSNPTWQYLDDDGIWIEYISSSGQPHEGGMLVEGECLQAEADCQIICVDDIEVDSDVGECGAYVELVVEQAGCDGDIENDFNSGGADASGFYPLGTTEVEFTIEGGQGCTVTVTVNNINPPTFENCPSDRTVKLDPGTCYYMDFIDTLIAFAGACDDGAGGPSFEDVLFTENASSAATNGFAGVTFDLENKTSSSMEIRGFRVPVYQGNGVLDIDVYYTTTASTNLDGINDPSAWTLLESLTNLPAQEAVAWDVNTFTQVTLSNVLTLAPGEAKGIYLFVTNYSTGPTYRYGNGTYTEENNELIIRSNGYGSNATPFGHANADRAFVGEVQYASGSGGGSVTVTQLDDSGFELGDMLPIGEHCFEFEAEDEDGLTSTCSFCITVEEYPTVSNSLTCNDLINVYLDEECNTCINAAHLLEGGPYGCYETRYTVVVATDAGFTDIIGEGSEVCLDGTYAGERLYGKVIDNETGNECVGEIEVFDTSIPELLCRSYTVDCGDDITPDAEVEIVDGIVLTMNHDTTSLIDALACAGTGTATNFYYRVLDMELAGIQGAFNVDLVNLGIYQSMSDIPSTLRFHTFNDPSSYDPNAPSFSMSGTTQIGDDIAVTIPANMNMENVSWDISDEEITVDPSSRYVIFEIEVSPNPADWVVGMNAGGEDLPAYLASGDCGITDPTTYEAIGFPGEGFVLVLYGSAGGGIGFPLPDGVTVTPPTGEGPFVVEGFDPCSDVDLSYTDEVVEGDCDSDFMRVIYRTWTAVDASGNETSCQDTINVRHPNINNFEIPEYVELDCTDNFEVDDNGNPAPTVTGAPDQGLCGVFYGYDDLVIPTCGGAKKIVRDFMVMYCCSGEVLEGSQVIKISDEEGPVIEECPADVTISTDFYSCEADYVLEAPIAHDACSEIAGWSAESSAGTIINGVVVGLPIGTHVITYTVSDDCGNESTCEQTVTVRDEVPPVAVCDQNTSVTLGADGEARIHWTTIEDGSYDNCGIVEHEVRRGDLRNNQLYCGDHRNVWGEYVYFCCADVGEVVEVEYRVTDASGNTNTCTVYVTVSNNLPEQIQAPGSIQISCEYEYDMTDLSEFGKVADLTKGETRDDIILNDPGMNNCANYTGPNWGLDGYATSVCDITVKELPAIEEKDDCGAQIIRTWVLLDGNGEEIPNTKKSQVIEVVNCNPFSANNIRWPMDVTGTCGEDDVDGDYGEPQIVGNPNDCRMVAWTYTDDVFNFEDDYCFKILRHWTVINCCVEDKSPGNGMWTYTQEIKVMTTQGPTIVFEDMDICVEDSEDCTGYIEVIPDAETCVPVDMMNWSYRVDQGNTGNWGGWNNGRDASGNYSFGENRIQFKVKDGCGHESMEIFTINVSDCTLPTPVCYADIATITMPPSGCVTIDAKTFDAGSWDNCTPEGDLIFSFSSDVSETTKTFCCNGGLGTKAVQIWVTDAEGNQTYCVVTLNLQDPDKVCGDASLTGGVLTERGDGVEGIEVELEEVNSPAPLIATTDESGLYRFNINPDKSYNLSSSSNADVLNGVSTWDLTLIQQHILGMNMIVSPYKLIAADINRDGRLTPIDLVELRRVILGLDKEFPNNSSWQMVVAEEDLDHGVVPVNYKQVIEIDAIDDALYGQDFVAVKIGDVNENAALNGSRGVETRSNKLFVMKAEEVDYQQGELVRIPVTSESARNILGYQMTLEFSQKLNYKGIESGKFSIDENNVGTHRIDEGILTMSWNEVKTVELKEGEVLFTLEFEAVEAGNLADAFTASDLVTRNEAYVDGEIEQVVLRVGNQMSELFALYQNEPNPFEDYTSISFDLPNSGPAVLTVYDAQGRVEHVVEGNYDAGRSTINIDRSDIGSAGVKYYTLQSGDYTATKKMIIIR